MRVSTSSTTTTTSISDPLLYSLPYNCPIPWLANPPYPIASTTRDLPSAYFDALYSAPHPPLFALDTFARLLVSLLSERTPEALSTLLRAQIHPLRDFDRRWFYTFPEVFNPVIGSVTGKEEKDKLRLDKVEKDILLEYHRKWEEGLKQKTDVLATGRASGGTEAVVDMAAGEFVDEGTTELAMNLTLDSITTREEGTPGSLNVQIQTLGDWLREIEALETHLQCLLLLTLLCLPPSVAPLIAGKRRKHPERSSLTLDPEVLLDFLTDRLQLRAAMGSIGRNGGEKELESIDSQRVEVERNESQIWWEDIVEPLFKSELTIELLSHHRAKLFPSSSSTEALTTAASYVPSPSPYKQANRSLLSLDKFARRKEWNEKNQAVSESPTMRRLVAGRFGKAKEKATDIEVFKVPPLRKRAHSMAAPSTRNYAAMDVPVVASESSESASTSARVRPRKQERPRPLPRGDSMAPSSKSLFNHREISVARKPTEATGLVKKQTAAESMLTLGGGGGNEETKKKSEGMTAKGRARKRKSVSPKKLPTTESTLLVPATQPRILLVEDTPIKPTRTAPPIFTRTTSLPFFAALGARFRPGQQQQQGGMFHGINIPPAPVLSDDEMDWEDERSETIEMGTPISSKEKMWSIPDT